MPISVVFHDLGMSCLLRALNINRKASGKTNEKRGRGRGGCAPQFHRQTNLDGLMSGQLLDKNPSTPLLAFNPRRRVLVESLADAVHVLGGREVSRRRRLTQLLGVVRRRRQTDDC